ncbi:helix-turn-helix transcriptional regulator [Paenibacillus sp. JNUCC31]|uniref:ArsR/SmtB family transcription factor n=1 Tax=Paenibacillus sp. JNUCC-31 TaxID=2777983 RepID=UPI00177E2FA3|nr:metalloregulator ArsR/SmtB family transcription factor [Paenibacillus sp. JNUCC-31]QOS79336.1 helix-turn-helix transcriptional regulator [Paenibacillus sp. JNUCC-31]
MQPHSKDAEQAVKIHKALGEHTRYKIIQILAGESNLCPADLENRLVTVALSTLSHHLKQLSDCGLLTSQKKGTYIYYSLNTDVVQRFVPYLMGK